jgi:hypothetical protein
MLINEANPLQVCASVLNMHLYRGLTEQGSSNNLREDLRHYCVNLVIVHNLKQVLWLLVHFLKHESVVLRYSWYSYYYSSFTY